MTREPRCTDEDLHRFIDGELDKKSQSGVQRLIETDPSLAARVRAYRSVDHAVRAAFSEVTPPIGRLAQRPMRVKGRGVAAALLLPVGFSAGWLVHSMHAVPEMNNSLAASVNLPARGREHLNTLFHIDVDNPAVMEDVLNRAEAILTAYADQDIQVEVVANASGLNLLRTDTSAVAGRVRTLMDKYANLTFVACANAIRRLKQQGENVYLIGRTHAEETAIDHVVERLREGWTYIKL